MGLHFSLMTTEGISLALVSTIKIAHRDLESQELRGEKALTKKKLTVNLTLSICLNFETYSLPFQEELYTLKDTILHGTIHNCLKVSKYIDATLKNSVKQKLKQCLSHIS